MADEVPSYIEVILADFADGRTSNQVGNVQNLKAKHQKIFNAITSELQNFLADYSKTNLPTATLRLIPAHVVKPLASPADDNLRGPDDFGRVARFDLGKGEDNDTWDHTDAEVVAGYLRFPRPHNFPEKLAIPNSPPPEASLAEKPLRRKKCANEDVTIDLLKVVMDAEAEYVVFRTETELGLYETQSLWAISIKVRVNSKY